MVQTNQVVQERYLAALDRVVARLSEDYYVLAVLLYGSLVRGEAWERSDIDLIIILRDGQERASRSLWIVEEDINIMATVETRSQFKKSLESALQGSIFHSIQSQSKLLFSRDETIAAMIHETDQVGAHDQEYSLLNEVANVMYPLEKAEKWFYAKHDLHYCLMWTLFAVNALAKVEVVLQGFAPAREALDQAMKLNPALFSQIYTGLIDGPKTAQALQNALDRIEGYLSAHSQRLFAPVLGYLSESNGPVTASELRQHFRKKGNTTEMSMVYDWLARQGIIHKLASPLRLTRKSQVTLEEPAYLYETDELADWE